MDIAGFCASSDFSFVICLYLLALPFYVYLWLCMPIFADVGSSRLELCLLIFIFSQDFAKA